MLPIEFVIGYVLILVVGVIFIGLLSVTMISRRLKQW